MNTHPTGTILANVPLFPLPQVVLFPGALLPLHVFEPRYRHMTEDVLSSNYLLCVVNVEDPGRVDALEHPEIASIATVGEVVEHERMKDGRFNILLVGRSRVHVDELPFRPPYRRARLVVLPASGVATPDARAALLSAAHLQMRRMRRAHPSFRFDFPADAETEELVDRCSHYLIRDASVRQRLLETLDVAERLQRCLEELLHQTAGEPSDVN